MELGSDIFSEFCLVLSVKGRNLYVEITYKYTYVQRGNAIKFIHKFIPFLNRYIVAMLNDVKRDQ